jgi:hypothetical protein
MIMYLQIEGGDLEVKPSIKLDRKGNHACNICYLPTKGKELLIVEIFQEGKWIRECYFHVECCRKAKHREKMIL